MVFIKILLCRNPLIIPSDALGGFAPAAAAPVRIAPYYLYTKVLGLLGNIEESQAPPPPAGQGWRKGGDHLKKRVSTEQKILNTWHRTPVGSSVSLQP